jgi:hypothetical protein
MEMNYTISAPHLGWVLCVALCSVAGCSDPGYTGPQRVPVSGTITFNGKPIPYGVVSFLGSGELRGASGPINEGKYAIAEKFGPNIGKYKVSVLGYPEIPTSVDTPDSPGAEEIYDDTGESLTSQMLPRKYNFQTTLEVDMVAGPNQHDFDLTSTRR